MDTPIDVSNVELTATDALQAMENRDSVIFTPEDSEPISGRITDISLIYAGKCEFEKPNGKKTIVDLERLQKPLLSKN